MAISRVEEAILQRYGEAGVKFIERDGQALWLFIEAPRGIVEIVADIERFGKVLALDQVHVDGVGPTRTIIRQVAQIPGEVEDVEEVIIQGGNRTFGARPGGRPTLIRVEVKQR